MPTYDYECSACGHTWELFQNITADPIKKCPACNKRKAVRQFGTGAALMFKGSGFYETDYRSDSYKKAAQADTKKPDSDKNSGGKTDSKSSEGKSSTASDRPAAEKKSDGSGSASGKSKASKKAVD